MSSKSNILKETCWAISNITAGTFSQIQAVIETNLIPPILNLLSYGDYKVKREACWAICNATSAYESNPDQIRYLVNQGCLRSLCQMLNCQDNKIIQISLDALSNILEVGTFDYPEYNKYAGFIEDAGGLETIFKLQEHDNNIIYMKSKNILEKYFSGEESESIDNQFHFDAGSVTKQDFNF